MCYDSKTVSGHVTGTIINPKYRVDGFKTATLQKALQAHFQNLLGGLTESAPGGSPGGSYPDKYLLLKFNCFDKALFYLLKPTFRGQKQHFKAFSNFHQTLSDSTSKRTTLRFSLENSTPIRWIVTPSVRYLSA